jgi:hypothetical protein
VASSRKASADIKESSVFVFRHTILVGHVRLRDLSMDASIAAVRKEAG